MQGLGQPLQQPSRGHLAFTSFRRRPVHRGQGPSPAHGRPHVGQGRACRMGASGTGWPRAGSGGRDGVGGAGRMRACATTTSRHDMPPAFGGASSTDRTGGAGTRGSAGLGAALALVACLDTTAIAWRLARTRWAAHAWQSVHRHLSFTCAVLHAHSETGHHALIWPILATVLLNMGKRYN